MLTRSLGALFLMIAAALVFISIQDPYTITPHPKALAKILEAEQINASEPNNKAFLSAKEFYKSANFDELKYMRFKNQEIALSANSATKQDDYLKLFKNVRILKDGALILSEEAMMNLKTNEIILPSDLKAFYNANTLEAKSAILQKDEINLKDVKLCINY